MLFSNFLSDFYGGLPNIEAIGLFERATIELLLQIITYSTVCILVIYGIGSF